MSDVKKFKLDCVEKGFQSQEVFSARGETVEGSALNWLRDFNKDQNAGAVEDLNTINFYGYIYMVSEVK